MMLRGVHVLAQFAPETLRVVNTAPMHHKCSEWYEYVEKQLLLRTWYTQGSPSEAFGREVTQGKIRLLFVQLKKRKVHHSQ